MQHQPERCKKLSLKLTRATHMYSTKCSLIPILKHSHLNLLPTVNQAQSINKTNSVHIQDSIARNYSQHTNSMLDLVL